MDIVARLIRYKDYTGLSNSQFADMAGIPRPTLSQFLNGRNKRLSDDMSAKLHVAYPNLNMMWLLFGEGDMLIDGNIEISEGKNEPKNLFSDLKDSAKQGVNNTENDFIQIKNPEENRKNEIINAVKRETTAERDKEIQYVMVFYTDNSYEVFRPGK